MALYVVSEGRGFKSLQRIFFQIVLLHGLNIAPNINNVIFFITIICFYFFIMLHQSEEAIS